MKKLLFILMLAPFMLQAQTSETIQLKDYGLNWTIENNTGYKVSEVEKDESYMKTIELKIRFEDHGKITITELKKPLTVPVFVSNMNKALKEKRAGVKLKPIVKEGNTILIERDYIGTDDRATIYKFMHGIIIKGKHYLIESGECDTLEECQKLLAMAKTIKTL